MMIDERFVQREALTMGTMTMKGITNRLTVQATYVTVAELVVLYHISCLPTCRLLKIAGPNISAEHSKTIDHQTDLMISYFPLRTVPDLYPGF
jgi:hypothetical protein